VLLQPFIFCDRLSEKLESSKERRAVFDCSFWLSSVFFENSYTAIGRNKLATLYFALVFGAGLIFALVCFGTNLYRTVSYLLLAQMQSFVLGLLVSGKVCGVV
jgi:hypothetical protein